MVTQPCPSGSGSVSGGSCTAASFLTTRVPVLAGRAVGRRPVVDWPPLLGGEEVGPSSACSFRHKYTKDE